MLELMDLNKSTGAELRLQRLLIRYNRGFWRGCLPTVQVRIRDLGHAYGQIGWKKREILIDMLGVSQSH